MTRYILAITLHLLGYKIDALHLLRLLNPFTTWDNNEYNN